MNACAAFYRESLAVSIQMKKRDGSELFGVFSQAQPGRVVVAFGERKFTPVPHFHPHFQSLTQNVRAYIIRRVVEKPVWEGEGYEQVRLPASVSR